MNKAKHISISNLQKCSGCGACANICPSKCIAMQNDKLECKYPKVDESSCIECGACVWVCPFINELDPLLPQKCYAAINKDITQRMRSSSGGVFAALAHKTINKGGVVFGAVFDEHWNVYHTLTETHDGIIPMMGSKYVQSFTGTTFSQVRTYLNAGREVLYTGTPCQIAGLIHFLGKKHPNLLAVEVVCHGVPAPVIWRKYLDGVGQHECELNKGKLRDKFKLTDSGIKKSIKTINFRDKRNGWKKYGIEITFNENRADSNSNLIKKYQVFNENEYMKVFLKNWSLRPSCFNCKVKNGKSHADITIGDFWGVENYPTLPNDGKGTSCVIARTVRGLNTLDGMDEIELFDANYEDIIIKNACIEKSVGTNNGEKEFKNFVLKSDFYNSYFKMEYPSLINRIHRFIKSKIGL